jgi:hypothetical protein
MTGKKKTKGKKERDGGTLECGRKNERKIEIERERGERRERENRKRGSTRGLPDIHRHDRSGMRIDFKQFLFGVRMKATHFAR